MAALGKTIENKIRHERREANLVNSKDSMARRRWGDCLSSVQVNLYPTVPEVTLDSSKRETSLPSSLNLEI